MADDTEGDPVLAADPTGEDDTGPRATVIQLDRPRSPKFDPVLPGEEDDASGEDVVAGEGADAEGTGEGSGSGDGPDGFAVVHPRLAERRDAIAEQTRHRRILRRIWMLLPAVLVVDGLAVAHSPLLDVEQVMATGSEHVPAATIAAASGVDEGDSLVFLDAGAAEERIEQLAWVADAEVVRDWDGTVRMAVRERAPAALVQARDELPAAVVDEEGRVLDIGGPLPTGLVVVTGVGDGLAEGQPVPARARDALRIALDAPRRVPGSVIAVSTDLEATLIEGGVVRFGSAAALEEKMVALATVLGQVDMTNVTVLDLGIPGHPTVTRH
jgi:cell division protein FtsQ